MAPQHIERLRPKILLLIVISLVGCVNTAPWVSRRDSSDEVLPTQAVVTWQPRVLVTADVVHKGMPLPGLAGRLYLFGPDEGCPITRAGALHIELFDARTPQPVLLETWDIDEEKMQLLVRRDVIGWGYTIFLPWSTYSPAINQVHMKVCFTPKCGVPLYAPTTPLRLVDGSCPPPVVTQHTEVPTAAPPTVPPGQQPNGIQLLPP